MSDLTVEQVNERLTSYDDTNVTSELYEFGKMLVAECVDRAHKLDAKATSITGYSGTIVALLVSTSSLWRQALDKWAVVIIFIGACLAGCGKTREFLGG